MKLQRLRLQTKGDGERVPVGKQPKLQAFFCTQIFYKGARSFLGKSGGGVPLTFFTPQHLNTRNYLPAVTKVMEIDQ